MTNRLSGRSSTGVWMVQSGQSFIGPFDGKSPAQQFRSEMMKKGVVVTLIRLHSPADARRWANEYLAIPPNE